MMLAERTEQRTHSLRRSEDESLQVVVVEIFRGHSSVGRALASQAGRGPP